MHYPASTNHDDAPGTDTPGVPAVPVRPSRRPRDLVLSLLVLVVPVLLLVGGYQVLADRHEPVRVAPDAQIAIARRAGLEVLAPVGLERTWVPVSAAFREADGGATLRIGYVTPQDRPVQLVQSSIPPDRLLSRELARDPAAGGTVSVDGVEWHRYPAGNGETALLRSEPRLTVLVVGSAEERELRELAGALR